MTLFIRLIRRRGPILSRCLIVLLAVSAAFSPSPAPVRADPINENGSIVLSGAGSILFSPITLADITGDGRDDILVGTSDGKVYAIRYKSTSPYLEVIWSRNLATDLGGPTRIRGAISVGDIDANGSLEVIVPAGDLDPTGATRFQGGVVALRASNGTPLWVYRTQDLINNITGDAAPDGAPDAVVSAPALGDLDNDGRLEIAFGGWDFRVHVIDSDGQLVRGWPVFVRDSVWSSPAMADLDDDGRLEVVIGVDAHAEGAPFNTPDGGCLYAFRANGDIYWRQCVNQVLFSAPAIGDIDGDGQLEIVHGTGEHFGTQIGQQVHAWRANGAPMWSVNTQGIVREGVALANLDGDSQLEVVASTITGNLQAWNHDGSQHWSKAVVNFQGIGNSPAGPPVVAAFNSADARPDVFANIHWDTAVHSGANGARLSAGFLGDLQPGFVTDCTASTNAPAVGDIDGDGQLELVSASGSVVGSQCGSPGKVFFWNLNSSASAANTPWPMFGQNARHNRLVPQTPARDSLVVAHNLPAILAPGQQYAASITLRNTGPTAWNASNAALGAVNNSDPFTPNGRLALNGGESIAPGATRTFNVTLTAPQAEGYYTSDWRMVSDVGGQWFGRAVGAVIKVGNQPALQVLVPYEFAGGVYPGGIAPAALATGYNWWPGAVFHRMTADLRGYYMLNVVGNMFTGGQAMPLALPPGGYGDHPQDMALGPDGISTYVLRLDGRIIGCDPTGCNRGFGPQVANARSFALTADGKGVYIVDGRGNIYRGGSAPAVSGAAGLPLPSDLIRRFKLSPTGGYYMMDVYGRVFNGGGAPPLAPGYSPQIGVDWARDFELTHDGLGYYLLDRDGRIHHGGAAAPLTLNPPPINPGQDIGRDLELLDTARTTALSMSLAPNQMSFLIEGGSRSAVGGSFSINSSGGDGLNWSIAVQNPNQLAVTPTNGSVGPGQSPDTVQITVLNPQNFGVGEHTFGLTVTGNSGAGQIVKPVSVKLIVAADLFRVYYPLMRR